MKGTAYIILLYFICSDCASQQDKPFGKSYNATRQLYGSPIIHDYMQLKIDSEGFQYWEAPIIIQNKMNIGYHAGKGFYIHADSVLQEDDIFRRRINDSTFAFIGILTQGNRHKSQFRSIYYDTVCAKDVQLSRVGRCLTFANATTISIEQADSILTAWGTSRLK